MSVQSKTTHILTVQNTHTHTHTRTHTHTSYELNYLHHQLGMTYKCEVVNIIIIHTINI